MASSLLTAVLGYDDHRYDSEVSPRYQQHPSSSSSSRQNDDHPPFSPGQQSYSDRLPSPYRDQRPSSERRPTDSQSVDPRHPLQCKHGAVNSGAVPAGDESVDHIEKIGAFSSMTSGKECVQQCCNLGPLRCQYVWIIQRECYAVACSDHPKLCKPMKVVGKNGQPVDSLYVEMIYEGNIGVWYVNSRSGRNFPSNQKAASI